jgi:thiol-disulfide isomerase/thioredoxin
VISRWSSPAGALILAGILLGSGVLGFLFHRLTTPLEPAVRVVPIPAGAAASPPTAADSAPGPRAIPDKLPDVSLPDVLGKPHRLADWIGRPLVVNFWATWCEPCRREIPLLEDLWRENSRNRLEIVGIAIDHRDPVAKFVHDLKIGYPVLVGEQGGLAAAAAFGMEPVLPFTVFADNQGRIVTLKIGELHRDEATFILARLADVQTGRLALALARERIAEEMGRLAAARAAGTEKGTHR